MQRYVYTRTLFLPPPLPLFRPSLWTYPGLPGAWPEEDVHTAIQTYIQCTYVSVSIYTISLSLSPPLLSMRTPDYRAGAKEDVYIDL